MITTTKNILGITRAVIWFAGSDYRLQPNFPSIAYFRQHSLRLQLPSTQVVHAEDFSTLYIDLENSFPALESGMSRTTRYDIRRAKKERVSIELCSQDHESIVTFVKRMACFNQSKKRPTTLSVSYLENTRPHWSLYSAAIGTAWLAHLLLIRDEKRVRQWVAFADPDFSNRALVGYASKAMVWQSIVDAQERKYQVYDFGGICTDEQDPAYGITQYKLSFGGYRVEERNSLVISNPLLRLGYRLKVVR